MIYPDTSFLLALYMPERQTARVRNYVSRLKEPLVYTLFHRLELRTAVRARGFREKIPPAQIRSVLLEIDRGFEEGIFGHVPLDWNEAFREAEEVARAHLLQVGARSGDLLHVASARVLNAEEFITFDQRQIDLAERVGLKVKTWR